MRIMIRNNIMMFKKIISGFVSFVTVFSVLSVGNPTNAITTERLRLSSESNLTLILGNTYLTGICGTISAASLIDEFSGDVTLTSPSGDNLSGDILVPSDTVISNGTNSIKALIYGDVDRNGRVNLSDAAAMLKFISKWKVDICEDAIDLNWDDKKNLSDVSLIMKKIAGWNVCIGVDIVPNQITLSYFDSDCTKIGVLWHAANKTHNPAVQVVQGDTDDFKDARTIIGDTNIGMGDSNSRAVIDGLEAGMTYSYRVGDISGYWSDAASFTMREADPEEFTFVCFTDTQSKNSTPGTAFQSAWVSAVNSYPETAFALHCGDVVETVGAADWSAMLDPSAEFLRRIPTMVVSGNHETSYAGAQGYKMQYNHFFTDMPEQSSFTDGYFYSFTYGDVHFIMLNTNKQGTSDDSLSAEQVAWLTSDLEANTSKWTIVLMHHPIYSPGTGSSDRWEDPMAIAMRAQLAPVFEKYGVDIVLAGHDHIYYRTHPINSEAGIMFDISEETDDGTVYYNDPDGVIYSTPGCTGSSSRSVCDTHPEYYAELSDMISSSYLSVKVEDDRITVNLCVPALVVENLVIDSWGIIK